MQLLNKKAIVTGGNQGIGKGIATALAKAGADVLIQYHSAKDKALLVVLRDPMAHYKKYDYHKILLHSDAVAEEQEHSTEHHHHIPMRN